MKPPPFDVKIFHTEDCYMGYVLENHDICATGETYEKCLENLAQCIKIYKKLLVEETEYKTRTQRVQPNLN